MNEVAALTHICRVPKLVEDLERETLACGTVVIGERSANITPAALATHCGLGWPALGPYTPAASAATSAAAPRGQLPVGRAPALAVRAYAGGPAGAAYHVVWIVQSAYSRG